MGRVMGVLGVPMLVAPIAGPILGGWLVDDVSWRWIFFINIPIGIVAVALALKVLERDEPQAGHKLDWLGMALLSPGLTALIFGLAESSSEGFGATKSWLPIVAGAAAIAGFFWHSWRAEAPLIDIRTFTHTRAGASAVTFMLFAIAFFGALRVLEADSPQRAHRLDLVGLLLLSPGLTALIFGLAESSGDGFGAAKSWGPIVAGALLVGLFLRHSWTAEDPLIDVRTFVGTRAGAAAGVFLLFSISFFGSLLLVPLYYQSVRGESALGSGLLLIPQGLGAMIMMPVAGRLTDRIGPNRLAAFGIPLVLVGISPFAFVQADTPLALLAGFGFVLGLGMGFSMMPTMTAAMQAVPPHAIARTSTAMNIIRQSGASVGTAIVSVILASNIKDELGARGAAGSGGFEAVHDLTGAQREAVAEPLASAFSGTFVWALVLLAVAFLPALAMALMRARPASSAAQPERSAAPVAAD
jgi:MFS family permease